MGKRERRSRAPGNLGNRFPIWRPFATNIQRLGEAFVTTSAVTNTGRREMNLHRGNTAARNATTRTRSPQRKTGL